MSEAINLGNGLTTRFMGSPTEMRLFNVRKNIATVETSLNKLKSQIETAQQLKALALEQIEDFKKADKVRAKRAVEATRRGLVHELAALQQNLKPLRDAERDLECVEYTINENQPEIARLEQRLADFQTQAKGLEAQIKAEQRAEAERTGYDNRAAKLRKNLKKPMQRIESSGGPM